MASYTIAAQYTTINVTLGGDDITPRGTWLRLKNLGANFVSLSELASPTGAPTAGNQTTLIPAGSGGKADEVFVQPNQKVFVKAAVGPTLIACEEIYNLPQKT